MIGVPKFEEPSTQIPDDPAARAALAKQLTAHPGRWALLGAWRSPGSARTRAYLIRQGIQGWQAFGPGFEVECHSMVGEHRIYVRYTEPAPAEQQPPTDTERP
ncbi:MULTISPECIES: hypothetical protein [unclassified Streptomyces]|uniref:hypothetical protein n=1 Tax=unclassified Streptomyces TaxID=2593676 RepID=UPI0037F10AFE